MHFILHNNNNNPTPEQINTRKTMKTAQTALSWASCWSLSEMHPFRRFLCNITSPTHLLGRESDCTNNYRSSFLVTLFPSPLLLINMAPSSDWMAVVRCLAMSQFT